MTGTEGNTTRGAGAAGGERGQPVEPAAVNDAAGAAGATAAEPVARAGTDAAAAADLAQRLAAAEEEVARLKNDYLRALAETENVRRRAARDRQDASQYAVSGFARDLLSVADNLNRALAAVSPDARRADAALDALMSGVEMTEKELLAIFERHGLKPIAAVGQTFDPHVHEALFEIPDPSVPHGTVLQVMQAGYTIHDRTLRPARVGIARGGPKPGAQPAAQPAPQPAPESAPEPAPEAAPAKAAAAGSDEGPSLIAEDDGVIQFPARDAAYRKPDDADVAGTRLDEDT